MLDELLEKRGLKYEELSEDERVTYSALYEAVKKSTLTLESLKASIGRMREAVESSLVDEAEYIWIWIMRKPNPKNVYLKARLKNYILLEALLSAPEKAKAMIEQTIGSMGKSKKDLT